MGFRGRWSAITPLSLGVLLMSMNATIVSVALPSIGRDLGLSDAVLAWVVNAYLATFGVSLLLGGRLADLFGRRRLYLAGTALFVLASLVCGTTASASLLIIARCVQGAAAAIVSVIALAVIVTQFADGPARARALGICALVGAGGGTLGLLLGGMLTAAFGWQWVFLMNVPAGMLVCGASLALLPADDLVRNGDRRAIRRAVTALVPLSIFRRRNLLVSCVVCALWAGGICTWFFVAALYLQSVLGYGPMQIGLLFLPMNLIVAGFGLGLTPRLIERFGVREPLTVGMALGAVGLALFARLPAPGAGVLDVLPATLLLGVGAGMAYNPLLLAAMSGVPTSESGLASGIVNAASVVGGALGLAVFASAATRRSAELLAAGVAMPVAQVSGYRLALLLAAACAAAGAIIGRALLRLPEKPFRATERNSCELVAEEKAPLRGQ